nr:MAG TPA: hypothetical protein [Caudoviricetes sp.]
MIIYSTMKERSLYETAPRTVKKQASHCSVRHLLLVFGNHTE